VTLVDFGAVVTVVEARVRRHGGRIRNGSFVGRFRTRTIAARPIAAGTAVHPRVNHIVGRWWHFFEPNDRATPATKAEGQSEYRRMGKPSSSRWFHETS
jgi:hypothetical protein